MLAHSPHAEHVHLPEISSLMTILSIAHGVAACAQIEPLSDAECASLLQEKDSDARTPLFRAVFESHLVICQYLLDKGSHVVMHVDSSFGMSPFRFAIQRECERPQERAGIVDVLLREGADVNLVDILRTSPLHTAAQKDKTGEMVRKLLVWGARTSQVSCFGDTPLHQAARSGNLAAARVLIEHGADGSAKNTSGQTPCDLNADVRAAWNELVRLRSALPRLCAELGQELRRHVLDDAPTMPFADCSVYT